MKRGRLIAFEGGEASGKSTQAKRLARHLSAVLTHEPGATDIGRRIRELLLERSATVLDPRAEALLLAADRAQHVAEIVEPALARGEDVVTDRFTGSSLAYQGFGRGLDLAWLAELSARATDGLEPDVVILLDVAPDLARSRTRAQPDRIEAEDASFHQRVTDGYHRLASDDPRWIVIDGTGTADDVERLVRDAFDRWAAASSVS